MAIVTKIGSEYCDHLFIAMVGNVGSGVTTTACTIANLLDKRFGYTVKLQRVSELIETSYFGVERNLAALPPHDKVDAYQTCGNELRLEFGDDFLARRCIHEAQVRGSTESRYAVIFDSFKHPSEIETLRKCFGDRLLTFTVFAPTKVRKKRLLDQGLPESLIDHIFDRDEFEDAEHGQNVRETAYLSDFFIRNEGTNTVRLEATIERYLDIVFGTKVHSPTFDEAGMARAFGAASSSACLSRQVGASVYDANGKLLATGCNDVPKAGGGLYGEEAGSANDNRCFNWKNKKCHNDAEKERIYEEIIESILPENGKQKRLLKYKDQIIDRIKSTRIRDLIEFSRSVHAEMDALVSVSRHGTGSTLGGTLFSKTFPCHNCARHIVASGISRVVFVEPYPKSLALKLHSDSISMQKDAPKTVHFVQYEGVSPKVASRFFAKEHSRKSNGVLALQSPDIARPLGVPEQPTYRAVVGVYGLENPNPKLPLSNDNVA